jgi:hypothetical protein
LYYATSDGQQLSERYVDGIIARIESAFDSIEDRVYALNPNYSVGAILDTSYRQILSILQPSDLALVNSIYRSVLDEERVDYAIDSFYELGALGYNEFIDMPGEEFTNLKNGYVALIKELHQNVSYAVRLNEQVLNIDLSASRGPVTVRTNRGVYQANFVVSTVSLGYLKSNWGQMFTPSLSVLDPGKVDSINRLGFGTVDKLFMVFNRPIFSRGEQGFQIFWKNDLAFLNTKYGLNVKLGLFFIHFYSNLSG